MAEDKGAPVTHCAQPAPGSASKPAQILTRPDQIVALAILPLAAHHLPATFPSPPLHSHGKHSPAVAAASLSAIDGISLGSSGSKFEFELRHPDTSTSAQQGDSILWLLPYSLLAKGNRSQIGNHALPSQADRMKEKPAVTCQQDLLQHQSTALMHMLLSGSQSAVCFDTQGKHPAFSFCTSQAMGSILSNQEHAASAKRSCIFTCDLDFHVHATTSSSSS